MDREDRTREKTEAGEDKGWGEHRHNNNYCYYNNYDLNNNNNTDNNINSRLFNSVRIRRDNHVPNPRRNLQVNPEEVAPPLGEVHRGTREEKPSVHN